MSIYRRYVSDSLVRVKQADDSRIWVPDSHGRSQEAKAQVAVREYDERLSVAQHNTTGDWCVYLTRGPFGEPYPVIGLGRELPHPDDILKLIHKYDAVRNGEQMLDQMNRHNEAIQAETKAAADDAVMIVAEAQESYLHGAGLTPYSRNFRPLKKTAVRGH